MLGNLASTTKLLVHMRHCQVWELRVKLGHVPIRISGSGIAIFANLFLEVLCRGKLFLPTTKHFPSEQL